MAQTLTGIIICLLPVLIAWLAVRFRIPKGLTIFIGVPGSGKTTLCARLKVLHSRSLKRKKHKWGDNFYSNVPILGAQNIAPKDLGVYMVDNGVIAYDEAGIDLNNREWKKLNHSVVKFAKYYRHYGIKAFCMFSQGMDIDITFVRLADRIAIVTKAWIPFFIQVRYAKKVVGIDENTHQLMDMYKWRFLGRKLVFAPTCWKYFDTYDQPKLPRRSFPIFDSKAIIPLEEGGKGEIPLECPPIITPIKNSYPDDSRKPVPDEENQCSNDDGLEAVAVEYMPDDLDDIDRLDWIIEKDSARV